MPPQTLQQPTQTPQPQTQQPQKAKGFRINIFYIVILLLIIIFSEGVYISFYVHTQTNITTQAQILPPPAPALVLETPPPITEATSSFASASSTDAATPIKTISSSPSPVAKPKTTPPPAPGTPKDTTAPTIPGNFKTSYISDTQVTFTWTKATDNVGVVGYHLYRNGVKVGSTQYLKYAQINLLSSTQYTFTVAAYDAAGNISPRSTPINVKTAAVPLIIAAPPSTAPSTPDPTPMPPTPPSAPNLCGNGTQDRGEECDDGNTNNNDNCTNICKAAFCMDNIINYTLEQCDDGNQNDNDYCDNQCHNHVPIVAPGAPPAPPAPTPSPTPTPNPSPTPNPTPTPSPTPTPTPSPTPAGNPTTYQVSVTSAGIMSPTSVTALAGDTVRFSYTSGGGECVLRFTPTPPPSHTLDSEKRTWSYTFTTAGTYTYRCTDQGGAGGTITVQ